MNSVRKNVSLLILKKYRIFLFAILTCSRVLEFFAHVYYGLNVKHILKVFNLIPKSIQ